jgi:hypothetical protein
MVSLPRNQFIAAGPQGPESAEGQEGPSGAAEVGGLVTSELCEELEFFC